MASLDKKTTISLLLGQAGSGKSWLMTRYLIEDFIPDHEGKFITNLPLKVDEIVRYCAKRYRMDEEDVRERIMLVPEHVHESWKAGESAPNTWFESLWDEWCEQNDVDPDDDAAFEKFHPLSGAMVVLDETMKFCPDKPQGAQKETVQGLLKYLTEARHDGCKLVFCTQDIDLVHEGLVKQSGFQIHLTNLGDSRLPYVGVRADTVLQLLAKCGLPYLQWVLEQEFITIARRRTLDRERRWVLLPWVFDFYESHSKEGGRSGKPADPEYIRFGWFRFLGWVLKENWPALTKCAFYLVLLGIVVWPGQGYFYAWRWAMRDLPKYLIPKVKGELAGQPAASGKPERKAASVEEARVDELVNQNETLVALTKELAVSVSELEAERTRLELEVQSSSQMSLIDSEGVILSNGDRVYVGGAISGGPFRDRVLSSVDVRLVWLCLMMVLSCGCSSRDLSYPIPFRSRLLGHPSPSLPTFADHYNHLKSQQGTETGGGRQTNRIPILREFSSKAISVDDFTRYVAHECGVSIVTDATLGDRQLTLELRDQPLDQVLSSIARHLGTQYHQASPSLYFLGAVRPQDESVLVRRVRGLTAEQIRTAVSAVSSTVSVVAYPDGLVVCSDLPETLQRVAEVLDQVESLRPGVWCVQLYLVTMSRDDMTDLGLDVTPALDVALTYGVGSGGVSAGSLDLGLAALLTAARERSTMAVTAEPLFYLVDGEKAVFERATQLPIPQRTVSDQGTVTVTGFQTFKAGTLVNVAIREVAGSAIRLTYDLELSSLRSVSSDGFPSSDRRSYSGVSQLQSGGVYLLGSIDLTEERSGRGTWLHSGVSQSNTAEVMQIWGRAVAVEGPALYSQPGSIMVEDCRENDEFTPGAELIETPEKTGPDEVKLDPVLQQVINPLRKESQDELGTR